MCVVVLYFLQFVMQRTLTHLNMDSGDFMKDVSSVDMAHVLFQPSFKLVVCRWAVCLFEHGHSILTKQWQMQALPSNYDE